MCVIQHPLISFQKFIIIDMQPVFYSQDSPWVSPNAGGLKTTGMGHIARRVKNLARSFSSWSRRGSQSIIFTKYIFDLDSSELIGSERLKNSIIVGKAFDGLPEATVAGGFKRA